MKIMPWVKVVLYTFIILLIIVALAVLYFYYFPSGAPVGISPSTDRTVIDQQAVLTPEQAAEKAQEVDALAASNTQATMTPDQATAKQAAVDQLMSGN